INLPPSWNGVYVGPEVIATNVQIRNNIWYNSTDARHGPNTTGMAVSDNYYINTPFNPETNVQTTPTTSPFVDWVNENYHLTAPTNSGTALSTPYNIDPDGVTRGAGGTGDRGAYEFGGAVPRAPVITS